MSVFGAILVGMLENTDQNNFKYGDFSLSVGSVLGVIFWLFPEAKIQFVKRCSLADFVKTMRKVLAI